MSENQTEVPLLESLASVLYAFGLGGGGYRPIAEIERNLSRFNVEVKRIVFPGMLSQYHDLLGKVEVKTGIAELKTVSVELIESQLMNDAYKERTSELVDALVFTASQTSAAEAQIEQHRISIAEKDRYIGHLTGCVKALNLDLEKLIRRLGTGGPIPVDEQIELLELMIDCICDVRNRHQYEIDVQQDETLPRPIPRGEQRRAQKERAERVAAKKAAAQSSKKPRKPAVKKPSAKKPDGRTTRWQKKPTSGKAKTKPAAKKPAGRKGLQKRK